MVLSWHKTVTKFIFDENLARMRQRMKGEVVLADRVLRRVRRGKMYGHCWPRHEMSRTKNIASPISIADLNQIGACDSLPNCAILLGHEKNKEENPPR